MVFSFVLFHSFHGFTDWWKQRLQKRREKYDFKSTSVSGLNALQWSMFLSDAQKEGWEFIGLVHEQRLVDTYSSWSPVALFRRLKLKG